jgi:hypothetical protein
MKHTRSLECNQLTQRKRNGAALGVLRLLILNFSRVGLCRFSRNKRDDDIRVEDLRDTT